MTSLCSSLPCRSRQTILQPVRKPGSMASTFLRPSGEDNSSSRRFSENTRMASTSARFLDSIRISTSIACPSKRL